MKSKKLVITGGLLLMVGAVMPWATISSSVWALTRTINGLGGAGILTASGGLILLLVGIRVKPTPGKPFSRSGVIVSMLCGLLIIWKVFNIATLSTEEGIISSSLRFGLSFLSPLGATFGLIGSAMKMSRPKEEVRFYASYSQGTNQAHGSGVRTPGSSGWQPFG